MILTGVLFSFLLTAIFVRAIGAILPDFEVDGWVPAFTVAVILVVAGLAVGLLAGPLTPLFAGSRWGALAFSSAITLLTSAIAFSLTPGIKADGVAIVIASVLLMLMRSAFSFALQAAQQMAAGPASTQ